jgi:hypothetical protein
MAGPPADAIVDRVSGAAKGVLKERPSDNGLWSAATLGQQQSELVLAQILERAPVDAIADQDLPLS